MSSRTNSIIAPPGNSGRLSSCSPVTKRGLICSDPIAEEFGHLSGQYVYLYYDDSAGAWVLYMSGSGVLAAAPNSSEHPSKPAVTCPDSDNSKLKSPDLGVYSTTKALSSLKTLTLSSLSCQVRLIHSTG